MTEYPRIVIMGPSGTGKSTVYKLVTKDTDYNPVPSNNEAVVLVEFRGRRYQVHDWPHIEYYYAIRHADVCIIVVSSKTLDDRPSQLKPSFFKILDFYLEQCEIFEKPALVVVSSIDLIENDESAITKLNENIRRLMERYPGVFDTTFFTNLKTESPESLGGELIYRADELLRRSSPPE